jgi:hypothetical protein
VNQKRETRVSFWCRDVTNGACFLLFFDLLILYLFMELERIIDEKHVFIFGVRMYLMARVSFSFLIYSFCIYTWS